ncbi:hypothetical protein BHM03_00042410 [Ensete ventricosum]|nr:hypothetical protein BHM03_00042410 [Ensete ventricosum]
MLRRHLDRVTLLLASRLTRCKATLPRTCQGADAVENEWSSYPGQIDDLSHGAVWITSRLIMSQMSKRRVVLRLRSELS